MARSILLTLLIISIFTSIAFAYISASLLDYTMFEPYIYALTYFDPTDGFDYFSLAVFYAPVALLVLWRLLRSKDEQIVIASKLQHYTVSQ